MDKGWFQTANRLGDRTLEQQMMGLTELFLEIEGKSVLDIGCAEGLISLEASKAGAAWVEGVEIVPGHVALARQLAADNPRVLFTEADANKYTPSSTFDIVLLLAILHKLRDPYEACVLFASASIDLCVIRLPPENAPFVRDHRTGFRTFDINEAMLRSGFELERVTRAHLNEWVGYYRRKHPHA